MNEKVPMNNCSAVKGNEVKSVLYHSYKEGVQNFSPYNYYKNAICVGSENGFICSAFPIHFLSYIIDLLHCLRYKGKRTGIVTTTHVTHASPAAAYANSPFRYHEGDVKSSKTIEPEKCTDIATQLVRNNSYINVSLSLKLFNLFTRFNGMPW